MVRVIVGGPTLMRDSNRLRKNYARYAMTSKQAFFNTLMAKRARIKQVPSCKRMRMKREFYIHMRMHWSLKPLLPARGLTRSWKIHEVQLMFCSSQL